MVKIEKSNVYGFLKDEVTDKTNICLPVSIVKYYDYNKEISQNSQENTCARVSFSIKKRLWHRCFPRAPFFRTLPDDCFYEDNIY